MLVEKRALQAENCTLQTCDKSAIIYWGVLQVVCLCASLREKREKGNWSSQVDWQGELRSHKNLHKPQCFPPKTALPFWKSLYFSHYFKYTYRVPGPFCLAQCGCAALPGSASVFRHHPNTATSPSVAAADARQCSACSCLRWQQPYHQSLRRCSSAGRRRQLFSAAPCLHISSLENHLPRAWTIPSPNSCVPKKLRQVLQQICIKHINNTR